ncbi:type II secretion system protein N [Methylocaldum szegediense]|jgi:type II secretory pathway component PulC|uniref:Type II secretion system protein GspC N-terminal domain-containing protein n=1 Tax=Methylocaldum szegediense TaxID=73780 RepID=A0ABN8X7S9_9GAMM|nr:type II secretion system protein N [Methylocaldum szegediense]CAI8835004.1 conserved protein of unknown function [Methylocaldum szegediense]
MTKWARDNLLTLILAGLAGLLFVAVAIESALLKRERLTVAATSEKAVAPETPEVVESEDFELPDIQDYETIVERPLFMEGRRPGVEVDNTTAAAAPDTPLTVKLVGVAFTPTDKTALLVDAKGKYKRLKKNGAIDGWTLIEFAPDRVTLQRGDEQRELMLLKPKPKTLPAQATSGQPHQAPPPQQQKPAPVPVRRPPPVEEPEEETEEIIEEEETAEEGADDVEQ